MSRHWRFCAGCGRRLHELPESETDSGEHSESDEETQDFPGVTAVSSSARPTAKRVRFN